MGCYRIFFVFDLCPESKFNVLTGTKEGREQVAVNIKKMLDILFLNGFSIFLFIVNFSSRSTNTHKEKKVFKTKK